jgi:hypothetical protein
MDAIFGEMTKIADNLPGVLRMCASYSVLYELMQTKERQIEVVNSPVSVDDYTHFVKKEAYSFAAANVFASNFLSWLDVEGTIMFILLPEGAMMFRTKQIRSALSCGRFGARMSLIES